jgi:hypothetical protein
LPTNKAIWYRFDVVSGTVLPLALVGVTMIGAGTEAFPKVMQALGFRRVQKTKADGAVEERYRPQRRGKKKPADNEPTAQVDEHSPFAKLRELGVGG